MTAELALRLGKAFGHTPQYWLNLQDAYDLARAQRAHAREIKRVVAMVE